MPHKRWIDDLRRRFGRATPPTAHPTDDWSLAQCHACSSYIPLEGKIGMDWGACSNPVSEHDRSVVFEHFGCFNHSHAHQVVSKRQ